MKEIIKKYYGYLIYLFLFAFALFTLIFAFSTNTYAYSINDDGNLVGDNLFNYDYEFSNSNLNVSTNNGLIIVNGNTNNEVIWITNQTITLDVGTYFISIQNLNADNTGLGVFVEIDNNRYENSSFTLNYQATIPVYMRLQIPNSIAANYSFNIMVNRGSTKIVWEPYGVWYSQNNYTDMENYYNDLLGNNPNVLYNSLYGNTCLLVDSNNFNTVYAQDIMYPSTDTKTFSQISLPNISNYLNNYDSENISLYPTPYLAIIINFNYQITNSLMFEYDNSTLDVIFKFNNTRANNSIEEHRDTTYPYFSVQNKDRFVYNQLIYDGIYLPDYLTIEFNLSIDGVAYANGYQDGINSQQTYINILKNEKQNAIDDLNNRLNIANNSINQLSSDIETLKALNEQLQENMSNSLGWSSLFFAFADTPFKVVSNVLGFELFGLNLFSTFIGMITVFGVVYLLKKFF